MTSHKYSENMGKTAFSVHRVTAIPIPIGVCRVPKYKCHRSTAFLRSVFKTIKGILQSSISLTWLQETWSRWLKRAWLEAGILSNCSAVSEQGQKGWHIQRSILNSLKSQQQRVRIQVFLAFKSSDTYPCQFKKKKKKKKDAFIALLNPPRTCPPSSSLSCFAGQRLCMKTFTFVVFWLEMTNLWLWQIHYESETATGSSYSALVWNT